VKKLSWKELPEGDILEAGSSVNFKTGDWRTSKPIWSEEKCTSCFICWIYCPDGSIIVEDGKVKGINYDYCKGCGICAKVCPPKVQAISMVEER